MEITQEVAERIINSKVIIDESLTPYKGVEVSYVGYVDSEGEPFKWEDTDEPYAIVSFKAMNEHQLAQAVEEFQDEDYEASANHNLSMRMNVEQAREVFAGASGTLICHEVELEDGEMALLPKRFAVAVAKTAKKVSLADLLAKKEDGKKGVKLAEAEEEPKASKKDKTAKADKSEKKAKKAK